MIRDRIEGQLIRIETGARRRWRAFVFPNLFQLSPERLILALAVLLWLAVVLTLFGWWQGWTF